jgi:MFS family permease
MLLAAFAMGLIPLVQSPFGLLMLALGFGLSQALIFPSTLALFAKKMDARHTGTGAGMIGALKNSAKVTGPILGGLLIHWQNYSWMFWSMALLLALWSFGLLVNILNERTSTRQSEYGSVFTVSP